MRLSYLVFLDSIFEKLSHHQTHLNVAFVNTLIFVMHRLTLQPKHPKLVQTFLALAQVRTSLHDSQDPQQIPCTLLGLNQKLPFCCFIRLKIWLYNSLWTCGTVGLFIDNRLVLALNCHIMRKIRRSRFEQGTPLLLGMPISVFRVANWKLLLLYYFG